MVAPDPKPRRLILTPREVRALLAGATQVRRVIVPQPVEHRVKRERRDDPPTVWAQKLPDGKWQDIEADGLGRCVLPLVAGQRYWGAEAFSPDYFPDKSLTGSRHGYAADWTSAAADVAPEPRWRSAATMPRWASRLPLLVESVREERVQDATEEDATASLACGWGGGCCERCNGNGWLLGMSSPCPDCGGSRHAHLIRFREAWDAEHPRSPWAANPWVAVGTVRRVEG